MPHLANKRLFSAFSSRNYTLFFSGQVVSLVGTWMTQTATLWLIYHLSSSAFLLGLVGFASQVPIFFLAPFAGVWIDRVNRHRLLVGTQVFSLLQSLGLAAFAFTGTVNSHILVGMSLLQGLINAFDMPVRQAMVVEFIEKKEHLGNAIALNSSIFNLARLIGPSIAGFVIAHFGSGLKGAGACYLIDGVSYLAVIVSLLAMRLKERPLQQTHPHPWQAMREGFHYAFGFPPIRALILMVAFVSFSSFSYSVLMPVFARDVLGGDARVLGFLMSATGIGALAGALYLGTRKGVRGLGNVILFGGASMAAGLVGFGLVHWLPVSLFCMMIVGVGGVLLMASSNTLVQTFVEDDKRGRVMSIYMMSFTGTTPLGNLAIGSLAGLIGASYALVAGGTICCVVMMVFRRNLPRLREIAAPYLAKLEVVAPEEPILYEGATTKQVPE